jgi:hypothetical protein
MAGEKGTKINQLPVHSLIKPTFFSLKSSSIAMLLIEYKSRAPLSKKFEQLVMGSLCFSSR